MSKVENHYSAKGEVSTVYVRRTMFQRGIITLKKAPFTAWLGMVIIFILAVRYVSYLG